MILSDVVAIALSIIGFLLSLQGLLACLPGQLLARGGWNGRPIDANAMASHVSLSGAGNDQRSHPACRDGRRKAPWRAGTDGRVCAAVHLHHYYSGIGTSGFVTHIGRRLESPADAGRPWRATVRGGVALELACLIPVLGWFGILPIFTRSSGAGADDADTLWRCRSAQNAIATRARINGPPAWKWRSRTSAAGTSGGAAMKA